MKVFGMVTTKGSKKYTPYALHSFYENTPISDEDVFYLVDNDNSVDKLLLHRQPKVKLLKNDEPLSFAANVNQVMRLAEAEKADLYFLNNDLIFTENWLEPIEEAGDGIISPFSNREQQYTAGEFKLANFLELDDYLLNKDLLPKIVKHHKTQFSGYRNVFVLPFFAVKIPYSAYSKIGPLDESFGRGGAEDGDYCLRAHLADVPVRYAQDSYILHFSGKSTWAIETDEEEKERVRAFSEAFLSKWGIELSKMAINYDFQPLTENTDAAKAAAREDFKQLVDILRK